MKYIVKVSEELSRHVIVEAKSEREAMDKVQDAYHEAKIVLDYEDYSDCDIECEREANENDFEFYEELEVENE